MNNEKVAEIYSTLLSELSLEQRDRDSLVARGFTDEQITAGQYRTFPVRRSTLVHRLLTRHGPDALVGVPGFWRDEATGQWQLAGASGLTIPIRNRAGQVTGIKIRPHHARNPRSKYIHLSSNPSPNREGFSKYPSGTSAPAQVHYPLGMPEHVECLRITEGELKADIATFLSGTYTISMPGVSLWRHALDAAKAIRPQRLLLAYDADKGKERTSSQSEIESRPHEVGISLAQLFLAAREEGLHVEIEDWPADYGKGIDDVLAGGFDDRIRVMPEDEAVEWARGMIAEVINLDWIYIVATKRFVHAPSGLELDKEQYRDRFLHEDPRRCPVNHALSNPAFPKIDFPTYEPRREQVIKEKGRSYYNMWRPSEVTPADRADASLFLTHTQYMIPDETERNVFLDFLAYQVQHPGCKVHWAMLLQGVQGTGKSYYGHVMRLLLGRHNVANPSNEAIHDKYTEYQRHCSLIVIEELMARGRMELMNKLKPMITQDIAVVREMYRAPYEQPNRFNFLIFTNYEDPIIIDDTDRRYCVIYSPAEPREADYYSGLWQWTERNAGGLLQWMLERDLTKFKPKAHAPMTAGKKQLIRASLPPLQAWMIERLEESAWPFQGDLVSVRHLADCLPTHLRSSSPQAVGRALRAVGAVQQQQVALTTGEFVRLWSVRRHQMWEGAEGPTMAQEYQKWLATAQPGGNPLMDARPL